MLDVFASLFCLKLGRTSLSGAPATSYKFRGFPEPQETPLDTPLVYFLGFIYSHKTPVYSSSVFCLGVLNM